MHGGIGVLPDKSRKFGIYSPKGHGYRLFEDGELIAFFLHVF